MSETNDDKKWSDGQTIAVAELGVTEIAEVGEDGVLFVRDRGSTLEFSPDEVQRRVRPVVSPEKAQSLRERFGTLGTPVTGERPYHRKKAYRGVTKQNNLEEMLTTLEGIYRHPDPSYAEERYQERLEKYVFGELATVLGEDEDELVRELRTACERDDPQ